MTSADIAIANTNAELFDLIVDEESNNQAIVDLHPHKIILNQMYTVTI